MTIDDVTHRVIRAAMAVHTAVGPGLLEKAYDACLYHAFATEGLLINFNVVHLRDGIRRVVNGYDPSKTV